MNREGREMAVVRWGMAVVTWASFVVTRERRSKRAHEHQIDEIHLSNRSRGMERIDSEYQEPLDIRLVLTVNSEDDTRH